MASDAPEGVKWKVRARQHCRGRPRSAGVRRRTGTLFRAPPAPGRGRRVAWSRWLCEAPARALPIQVPHRARLAARPTAPWWMAHGGLPTHGSRGVDTQRHYGKSVHGPYRHPTILRADPRPPPPGSTPTATPPASDYCQRQSSAPTTDRTAQARDGPRPDRTSSTNGPLSNPSHDCESVQHPPSLPATPNVSDLASQPPPGGRRQSTLPVTARGRRPWARSAGVPRPLFSDGYEAGRRCGSSQV